MAQEKPGVGGSQDMLGLQQHRELGLCPKSRQALWSPVLCLVGLVSINKSLEG